MVDADKSNKKETEGSLGAIYLHVPATFAGPILWVFGIGMLTCLLLWTIKFSKKLQVPGALETIARPTEIVFNDAGLITAIVVKNGDKVKKGDLLAVIDKDIRINGGRRASSEQLASFQTDLARIAMMRDILAVNVKSFESREAEKLASAKAEKVQMERALAGYKITKAELKERFQKMKVLYRKKLVVQAVLEGIRADYQSNNAKILQLSATLEGIDAKIKSFDLEKRNALNDIEKQKIDLNGQAAEIQSQMKEISATKAFELRASGEGIAALIKLNVGDAALPGRPFVTLVPETNMLKATLFVPASVMPYVDDGQSIWVSFLGFAPNRGGLYPARLKLAKAKMMEAQKMDHYQLSVPSYQVELDIDQPILDQINKRFPIRDDIPLFSKIPVFRRRLVDWITDPIENILAEDDGKDNPGDATPSNGKKPNSNTLDVTP